jgi:uncharacterized protein YheU (UPF0270 family)
VAQFLEIPPDRLQPEVLHALLEEFASRDGTDYGEVESTMVQRIAQLMNKLDKGEMVLLYDSDGEHWDLLPRDRAAEFLAE